MMRVVLDTNVLASGFTSQAGTPGQILLLWTYGAFVLVVSEHILAELARTFEAPYFQRRLARAQATANITFLRHEATITPITATVHGVATHPEDDVIVATAMSGNAEYLVTGDKPLQNLGAYQGVILLSPFAFLDLLKRQYGEA